MEIRPIDANALFDALYDNEFQTFCPLDEVSDVIAAAPILDYSPVRHGEWTAIDASYWRWLHDGAHPVRRIKYRHDECGKIVITKEPYCPNCGAKMDGGEDDA